MTLIKGFEENPQTKGFSGDTLEWHGTPIKALPQKELIDVIVWLCDSQKVLQERIRAEEQKNRIIQPYS